MTHTHKHEHEHGHAHCHKPANYGRAFAVGILLNVGFVGVEAVYGFLAHSIALLADASHNLSDVLSLLLAWGANVLSRRAPSQDFTYGLRSSSILAALVNAVLLLVVTGGIALETMQRLMSPTPVAAETIIWVAALGVLINTATALLFMSGRKADLNIRGAFLHMATDAAVSLGVVLAGVGILVGGWLWLDPAVSLLIVIVILISTWGFLWESIKLALHAVPVGINPLLVRSYLVGLPGVAEAHDFHVWGMSTTETALTVHLVMPDGHPGDVFMAKIAEELHDRFHIQHATLQVELGDGMKPCVLASDHIV
jgi:cobalt-zinc-cadmium efflux system protein